MTTQTQERLSLADLTLTSEYKLLTIRQQTFVSEYIRSGVESGTYDTLFAVTRSYRPKNAEVASVMAAQVMGNSKVKDVLDLHFGRTEKDAFLRELKKTIQHSTGIAKVRAQAIYARLAFGYDEPGDDAPEAPKPAPVQIVPADNQGTLNDDDGNVVGYRDASGKDVLFESAS
jgi:hypothetical protein